MSDSRWDQELVERLTEFAKPDSPNRAVLAHLRRGLDGPLDYTLGRVGWLFRRVPESKDDVLLRSSVLAAGLFAWVKGECRHSNEWVNFGAAFGDKLTLDEKHQREKRFIDLLDTGAEELPYKLRQAITLIGRERVGLNWVLLIKDLANWGGDERRVQQGWARGFWSAPELETTADQEQPVSK